MPGLEHEAAVELLRRNPELTAALLANAGVPVPAGAMAVVADSNLSLPEPTELRADLVTLHPGTEAKLAVVTEVQKDCSPCNASPASMPNVGRLTLGLSG